MSDADFHQRLAAAERSLISLARELGKVARGRIGELERENVRLAAEMQHLRQGCATVADLAEERRQENERLRAACQEMLTFIPYIMGCPDERKAELRQMVREALREDDDPLTDPANAATLAAIDAAWQTSPERVARVRRLFLEKLAAEDPNHPWVREMPK